MKVNVKFFYHLKEKAGVGNFDVDLEENTTIGDLISILENRFPALRTHLRNVMILMDKQIVVNDDPIKDNASISFLTPIGGG